MERFRIIPGTNEPERMGSVHYNGKLIFLGVMDAYVVSTVNNSFLAGALRIRSWKEPSPIYTPSPQLNSAHTPSGLKSKPSLRIVK